MAEAGIQPQIQKALSDQGSTEYRRCHTELLNRARCTYSLQNQSALGYPRVNRNENLIYTELKSLFQPGLKNEKGNMYFGFLKIGLLMAKSSCQFLHGRELIAKSKSAVEQQPENIHMNGLTLAQMSHTTLPYQRSLTFEPEQ